MPTYNNIGSNNYKTPSGIIAAGAVGFETTDTLDHLDGIVRTDDLPAFNLLRDRHDETFTGAGSVAVQFAQPQLLRTVLITSTVDLDMHINVASNDPPKRLLAGKEYFLVPNGKIDGLVFDHQADGTVIVEEVGPKTAEASGAGGSVIFGGVGVTFGGEGVTW